MVKFTKIVSSNFVFSKTVKGRGHIHFMMHFSALMLSLGDGETQNKIFKNF